MQYVIRFFPLLFQTFFGIFLVLFLGAFLWRKELPPRILRWGFFCSLGAFILRGILYSIGQYRAWAHNPLSQHFLPPEDPFYFFRYSLFHFFSSFFLSLFIASLLLVIFWILGRRSHGRLLDSNECLLVFFGALAAGWPGAILYAGSVFVLPLLATPWLAGAVHDRRVRLAPFIIISALLTMGLTPYILLHTSWLTVFVCNTCL